MESCSSSSSSSSARSSPDLSPISNYRTIQAPITAFKMWRFDNQAEINERFPDLIGNPEAMYSKMRSYWRYRVSQHEKDYYHEKEAEIKAGGKVEKVIVKMEPILEAYEENVESSENEQNSKQEHIKRPMNAFMVWSKEARGILVKRDPNLGAREVSRRLGDDWRKMSDREKKPFYEQAERLKKQHQKMYPGYKFQPKRLMTHLESMNRRLGRKFDPIYLTPKVVAKSSESTSSSESPPMTFGFSKTPILESILSQHSTMIPVLQNHPESESELENQNPSLDPYTPATMKQRYDLHLLPSRLLCPESDENFSIFSDIPMVLGYADLPVFY